MLLVCLPVCLSVRVLVFISSQSRTGDWASRLNIQPPARRVPLFARTTSIEARAGRIDIGRSEDGRGCGAATLHLLGWPWPLVRVGSTAQIFSARVALVVGFIARALGSSRSMRLRHRTSNGSIQTHAHTHTGVITMHPFVLVDDDLGRALPTTIERVECNCAGRLIDS